MIIHLYNLFTQTDNEINGFKKDKHMSLQDFPLDLAYLGASFSLLFYRLFPSSSIDPVANIYFFFLIKQLSPPCSSWLGIGIIQRFFLRKHK